MHPGIANLDLSQVTSSLDDKMASTADASTGNSETKTQINVNWTNYQVAAIIDIWATVEIQGQLDGMRRNKKVYEQISEEMAARGFVRTFKQCRNKIKWLKHEYKRVNFCAGCIGKRDSRVVSATKMPCFFSRPC